MIQRQPRAVLDTRALQEHLEGAGQAFAGPLEASLITSGRSNLTFAVTDGSERWIVRRPPLGHVLPTAHDVGREHTVMAALATTDVPVPEPVHLCHDATVIGAPFLVMEYIDGLVIHDARDAEALTPEDAGLCTESLIETLARLHRIDPHEVGLDRLGRPSGYISRQLRRWRSQWTQSTTETSLEFEELADLLEANVPASSKTAIVHGDYRLGNVILHVDDPGSIAAVIDWEMATLGDPLADVGLLLAYWHPASMHVTAGGHAMTANAGFPDSDRLLRRYAERSGAKVDDLAFHRVFGFFKLAVIAQTIFARHLQGAAVGSDLASVGGAVESLLDAARSSAAEAGLRR
jgi:aminoglycoside phosphotransferase (APT) family kinase protein